jgi:DNA-binding NarL/FixJ family response regulator
MAKRRVYPDDPARLPDTDAVKAAVKQLSPREVEVMRALLDVGLSNIFIGRMLGISPRTVEVHRLRLLEKVGVKNTVQLVRVLTLAGF